MEWKITCLVGLICLVQYTHMKHLLLEIEDQEVGNQKADDYQNDGPTKQNPKKVKCQLDFQCSPPDSTQKVVKLCNIPMFSKGHKCMDRTSQMVKECTVSHKECNCSNCKCMDERCMKYWGCGDTVAKKFHCKAGYYTFRDNDSMNEIVKE